MFGAYIHMDEETPYLHLDFTPWVSGSERGLETRTSLKGALASRGFASEGKGNTKWQQWSKTEKEDIASIMERYGIGWHKKGSHNKHLSVLDDKKQECTKEVAALEAEQEDVQEENRTLKDKLEKAYEFVKQFVIGGMNLLEKFMDWIGEKVRDVGRGR